MLTLHIQDLFIKPTSLLNIITIMEEHYIFVPKLCRMYMEDHEELSQSFTWAKGVCMETGVNVYTDFKRIK
jgi:predicted metal-binding protein